MQIDKKILFFSQRSTNFISTELNNNNTNNLIE